MVSEAVRRTLECCSAAVPPESAWVRCIFFDAFSGGLWLTAVMADKSTPAKRADPVTQLSVFTPNRLGRLHDLISLFDSYQVHVLALTVLDTTDSSIIRLVVDDPDRARALLREHGFPFTECPLLVVEFEFSSELGRLMAALLEAELNINYLYSFIPYPAGRPLLALSMEDNEMGEQVLRKHQFRVLLQADISR